MKFKNTNFDTEQTRIDSEIANEIQDEEIEIKNREEIMMITMLETSPKILHHKIKLQQLQKQMLNRILIQGKKNNAKHKFVNFINSKAVQEGMSVFISTRLPVKNS